MKLKKILSALTAAAMAVSVMAVTPVSVGAATLAESPGSNQTVLATVENSTGLEYTGTWASKSDVKCYPGQETAEKWLADSSVYLKLTATDIGQVNVYDAESNESQVSFSEWFNSSSNTITLFNWYNNYSENANFSVDFQISSDSTEDTAICYAPISSIKLDEYYGFGGNLMSCGVHAATVSKIEVVKVIAQDPVAPTENVSLGTKAGGGSTTAIEESWGISGKDWSTNFLTDIQSAASNAYYTDVNAYINEFAGILYEITASDAETVKFGDLQVQPYASLTNYDWISGNNNVVLAEENGKYYTFMSIDQLPADKSYAQIGVQIYDNVNFTDVGQTGNISYSVSATLLMNAPAITGTNMAEIVAGETLALTAESTPAGMNVSWTSSDEKIATVDSTGVVTAVAEGQATITATLAGCGEIKADCVVTVKPAKTVISPVLDCSADSITIYTEDTDAAKIAAAKSKVTLSGTGVNKLTADDYVIEATIKDNVVTLVFQLKNTDDFEIDSSFTGATATVTVTYSDWQPVVYNGYEIKGDLAIDVEADAEWTEVESIIGAMTIALTVSDEYAGYNDGEVTSELLKNCAVIEKATLTPGAVVTVNATINLGDVMNNGDKYIDASDITLGTSGAEKTELTVTFTVTVAEEEIVEDEEPDDGEEVLPDDDIINDGEGVLPDDDVIGDEEEVLPDDDDTTDGEDGVIPDDDVIEDEEPDDEEEVLPEEPKPSIPVITLPAKGADGPTSSVWAGEGQVNNAVGTGRATSSVMTAKSGATINVVVENSDYVISKKLLEKLANKKNVTVNFLYTGCTITINSDDINANIVTSIDPYKSVRFLTRAEAKMFADAKDYRQFRFTSADMKGIEKFTLTVKMKGSAKKADADLLKRNAANDFELIAESKVGADRTVSFEITESANYVVVAGEYTLD